MFDGSGQKISPNHRTQLPHDIDSYDRLHILKVPPAIKTLTACNRSVSAPQKRKSMIEEVLAPPPCYNSQATMSGSTTREARSRHMTEQPLPLITFYQGWETYQHSLVEIIAPLSSEQLAFPAASLQWTI